MELTTIVALLEPCAKSIKCLESSHSTPATVMKFWVATLAAYEELLKSAEVTRLQKGTVEAIRMILNRRYKSMINNAPSDCYLTALFLDPGTFVVAYMLLTDFLMVYDYRLPKRTCCR